jgi:hypothetical protein
MKNEDKLYVTRPIRESLFDEDFRIIGTKEDIAEYVKSQVEYTFDTKELKFKADSKQRLFLVEFNCGSADGKTGWGSSGIFKSLKEAKDWMEKYLNECKVDAPQTIIFNINPIYWVKRRDKSNGKIIRRYGKSKKNSKKIKK